MLTKFQTPDTTLTLLQSSWASAIDPILDCALVKGVQVKDISLVAGVPKVINNYLGRMQQGYIITDMNADARVWRVEPFNNKTLTLQSTANVTISLWMY